MLPQCASPQVAGRRPSVLYTPFNLRRSTCAASSSSSSSGSGAESKHPKEQPEYKEENEDDPVPAKLARMERELALHEDAAAENNDYAADAPASMQWVRNARRAAKAMQQQRSAMLGHRQQKKKRRQETQKQQHQHAQNVQELEARDDAATAYSASGYHWASPRSERSLESAADMRTIRSYFAQLTNVHEILDVLDRIPSDAAGAAVVALERLVALATSGAYSSPASALHHLKRHNAVQNAADTIVAYAGEVGEHLPSAMHALARLGSWDVFCSHIEALARELAQRESKLLPESSVLALDALCRSKVQPPAVLEQRLSRDIRGSSLQWAQALTPERLATLLHSCAVLRCTQSVLEAVQAWAISRADAWPERPLGDFDASTVSACLWALAVEALHDISFAQMLWHEACIKGPAGWAACKGAHHAQLYQAALARCLDTGQQLSDFLQPRSLRRSAYNAWLAQAQKAQASDFGRDVATALQRIVGDADVQLEYSLHGIVVDAFVQHHGLVVEADGPSHFLYSSEADSYAAIAGKATGQTMLKRRLLTKMGYIVASVPLQNGLNTDGHVIERTVRESITRASRLQNA